MGHDSEKSAPQTVLEMQERKSIAPTESKAISGRTLLRFRLIARRLFVFLFCEEILNGNDRPRQFIIQVESLFLGFNGIQQDR